MFKVKPSLFVLVSVGMLFVSTTSSMAALDDVYVSRNNDFVIRRDSALNELGLTAEGTSTPMRSFNNGDIIYAQGSSLIKKSRTLANLGSYNMGGFVHDFAILANNNVVVSFQDSGGLDWFQILDSNLNEIGQNRQWSLTANGIVGLSDGTWAVALSDNQIYKYDQAFSQIGDPYNSGFVTTMDIQSDDDIVFGRQGFILKINSDLLLPILDPGVGFTGFIPDLTVLADDKVVFSAIAGSGNRWMRLLDSDLSEISRSLWPQVNYLDALSDGTFVAALDNGSLKRYDQSFTELDSQFVLWL